MPKASVKTLDATFSRALRASYDDTCQYPNCPECGNVQGGADDCSHYYGRRYRGGRWYPDNCIALCRLIHCYVDKHHAEHVDFIRRHLGDVRHDALIERMQANFHYSAHNRWAMHEHYKGELKRIEGLRLDGEMGYIRLVSYD